MIQQLGFVRPGSTLRIPFNSFDKDDGSSITMTNFAAADILIYKDGSTTERASTSGYTATTDFDSKTGKHLAIIDLADNTTANFFAAGSEYLVAIDAVTVDGVTVGGWIARFTIGRQDAMLNTTIATVTSQTSITLTSGPAEDNALVGMWGIIHDVASAVQMSPCVVSAYTGSTKTVTLASAPTFTIAANDNVMLIAPIPLQPTTLGRTLDVSSGGEAGLDWANIGSPTTSVALTGTTVSTSQQVDVNTIKTQTVTCSGGVTIPAATLASTTNITTVGAVSGAVGSVTGNVGGSVASVTARVTANTDQWNGVSVTGMPMPTYTQPTGFLAATFPTTVASTTNITAATGITVATNNDKTGYSLTQTFPSNFSSLAITAGGIVQADLQTIKTQTVTCSGGVTVPAATLASTSNITTVGAVSGAVGSVTGNVGGSVASVTARVTANTDQLAGQTVTAAAGVTFPASVASPTNITTASGITLASTTHTGAVIPTVTTLTNDPSGVTTLLSRVPSGIFTGMTSLAQWLGLLAGKQTGNTTARTELRATGAGSGTFDETTDSVEAIRDRGDAAWITATGFATSGDIPSAATIADAVWDEVMSGHTTSGTYGGRIPRSDSANVEVKITGSKHTAADIHELQPAVIQSTHFAAGAIDANAVAADAVADIQSGLATSAAVAAIPTTIRMKKNTALSGFQIVMLDSTTEQPATGVTVAGTVSKDGAAFGALTNSVSEIGSGAYTVDLAAGDTNGNCLLYKFAATGCKTLFVKVITQP